MRVIDPNVTTCFDHSAPMKTTAFSAGLLLDGTFRLEELLGRGGMGEVWKAYDTIAGRYVVLKFVPKEAQHTKNAMESVKDSFKKIHELQHQHICPVYSLQNNPEHGLYLVMKFIDGIPLDEYKRRVSEKSGKIASSDVIQILWGIARGLDYAHSRRVLHRDIKPQNIMISQKDGVQIIDFGLAAQIQTNLVRLSEVQMEVLGTRPYMSPEQWQGQYQDAKSDQYALGVTAYELFAGHFPFQGSDAAVLRECAIHEIPEPVPDVPDYVNAGLLKALAKKREDRFENCKSFVRALARGETPARRTTDRSVFLQFPVINSSKKETAEQTTWRPKSSILFPKTLIKSLFSKKPADETVSLSASASKPTIKIAIPDCAKKSDIPSGVKPVPVIHITAKPVQKTKESPRKKWRRYLPAGFAVVLLLIFLLLLALL